MTEEPLLGGNNTPGVVRVGWTVRRPGRAFAGSLLRFLEEAGYTYAPRHLGVDDQGRDILEFVDGMTTDHPSQRADGAYAAGARMLRELHDTTAGTEPAGDRECVIHGDPGPFNTIFVDGRPVAFIDWDSARPGERIEDVGYAAWTWCILSRSGIPAEQQAARVREFRRGYGGYSAAEIVDAMISRQGDVIEAEIRIRDDPARGAARREQAVRAIAWAAGDRAYVRQHRELLAASRRRLR